MFVALLARRSQTLLAQRAVVTPIAHIRPHSTRHLSTAIMAATKRKVSATEVPATNGDAPPLKRRASSRKASTAVVNPDENKDVFDAPNATRASPDNVPDESIVPGHVDGAPNGREESPLSDAPDVVEPPKPKRGRGKKAQEKHVQEAESVVAAVVDAAESNAPVPAQADRGRKKTTDAAPPTVNGDAAEEAKPAAKKGRGKKKEVKIEEADDAASVASAATSAKPAAKKKAAAADGDAGDPEAEGDEDADPEELKSAASRPPPVNSSYLPLPWKGRLGYACLNTYLRQTNPPIFCSRTTRIQSILEHRHPLADPSQPEHPTKNRPDRSKPADMALGQKYVENLCLANVKDLEKMLRWNERYHIRFMRLSSEMFPFASHPEYGYKLAPFAADALAEAGKVVAELGHRVTTHPGQFTQLGSPRQSVIDNAIRDLDYHDEMLSLLKLPDQLNRDAVMILHMGGIFEGKAETIARFKENYAKMSDSVKARLVLENDDVCYSVHDLLPVCEELNIPFVLDWHHHNIVFDAEQIREGTADVERLMPRILKTWERKGITPKMHYSEQTPPAITGRQRRKHNPRVWTLPPCPPTMDLMIEAKDKEQACFELMRTFKLPGYDSFADIIPYERHDDNKFVDSAAGQRRIAKGESFDVIPDADIGMGGPEGRVYWPLGMEEWLRPKKKEVKKKDDVDEAKEKEAKKKEKKKAENEKLYAERQAAINGTANGEVKAEPGEESDTEATPATKKAKAAMKKRAAAQEAKAAAKAAEADAKAVIKEETTPAKRGGRKKKEVEATVPTPGASDEEEEEADFDEEESDEGPVTPAKSRPGAGPRRKSGRAGRSTVSYAEEEDVEMA